MGNFDFLGPNRLILDLELGSKIILGSIHIVKQLLFSMFPLFLTFDFDFIL